MEPWCSTSEAQRKGWFDENWTAPVTYRFHLSGLPMEASPPSSLVLGIRPGGQDPASQWERERSSRRRPPVTWDLGARGSHLLVTGEPGSGHGAFCEGLIAQAIENKHGVVLFEVSDRFERGQKAFHAAEEHGQEVHLFDWTGLEKAHEMFRLPVLQSAQARNVTLISLPDSEQTLSMLWGAIGWLMASAEREWKPGHTVLFWPEVQWTFDGLRHRLACSKLADRQVSTLFHSPRLDGLRNHGGDSWWHNLLEPLKGVALFRNSLRAPVLDVWNELQGPRQGPQAYPDSLDLRDLLDKQAWLDLGEGWEQVRAFQPSSKPNPSQSRFLELAMEASKEAQKVLYVERAAALDSTLSPSDLPGPRVRL